MDPRGVKGSWEALVFYVNRQKTVDIEKLADQRPVVRGPACRLRPQFRKPDVKGITAKAIDVVIETGESGPVTPIGINLPNDQKVREQHGSKSVSLSNVTEAYDRSTIPEFRKEFAWAPEEVARAGKWSAFSGELHTNMHEVIGHASGRMADDGDRHPGRDAQGAVLGARGRPRRPHRPLLPAPIRSWPSSASSRPRTRPRSSRPSTRPTPRTRWSSCAGCAQGIPDRRGPHAQPPDDRALADGQHQGHRRPPARRQDVLRDDRRDGLPRRRRAGCSPRCSGSRAPATTPPPRRCSRPTACTSTRSCATRSWRGSTRCTCRPIPAS